VLQGPTKSPMSFNISMSPLREALDDGSIGIMGVAWSDDLLLLTTKDKGQTRKILERDTGGTLRL
jgi:hypothetical protein